MPFVGRLQFLSLVAATVWLAACSTQGQSFVAGSSSLPVQARQAATARKIQHVIIIIQENRTIDNFLQTSPLLRAVGQRLSNSDNGQ